MISHKVSKYADYLPSILKSDNFLGGFLLAFEKILSGFSSSQPDSENQVLIIREENTNPPGFEEILDHINSYFSGHKTPEEFLPWLASWVSLSLREDWSAETKRNFVQQIVPLYQERGTKTGLEKILKLYLKSIFPKQESYDLVIFDDYPDIPHYFQVDLNQPSPDQTTYTQMTQIVQAIIEQEKPMQTFYALKIPEPSADYSYSIVLEKPCDEISVIVNLTTEQKESIINVSFSGFGHNQPDRIEKKEKWENKYKITTKEFQYHQLKVCTFTMSNQSAHPVSGTLTIRLNPADSYELLPPENQAFILAYMG